MKIFKISAWGVLIILIVFCGFLLFKAHQVNTGRERINAILEQTTYPKLENPGTVDNLAVLPLIDFFAHRDGLETEFGVSYLLKADDTTILMDTGVNLQKNFLLQKSLKFFTQLNPHSGMRSSI